MSEARPFRLAEDGIVIAVRATPRGGHDAVEGLTATGDAAVALKVRVRAAPADGAANEAIARILARTAQVPPRDVKLLQGAAGRLKIFHIAGDPVSLAAAIDAASKTKTARAK